MRIAYLDCFSGISGDMFLGALVDAGVSAKLMEDTAAALDVGARIEVSRVVRSGIRATKVDVYCHGEKDLPREVYWEEREKGRSDTDAPEHFRQRAHDHDDRVQANQGGPGRQSARAGMPAPHGTLAPHGHEQGRHLKHEQGRHLNEIRRIIDKAAISAAAKATAIRVFEVLGAVEAEIHGVSVEDVHFHEVGAVDAMVDIVCGAVGADALGVDDWMCSPLNVGGGTVQCAHGILPVPAPATLKLLQDAPVFSSGPQVELVTPTGAAIVRTLATQFGPFPAMRVEKAGYGAGSRDFPGLPNVVRLTVGQAAVAMNASAEMITVLEANLDDLSPQVLAYAMERLLGEGALDVFSAPVQMKKNRPGALLTVLAKPEDADRLAKLTFAETTTLGIRRREERRHTLARRSESVETRWGAVRIKIASMNGTVANYAPEYEDCRRLAEAHRVPLKAVLQEALQEYLRSERKA